jgi:hypothetical protein
MSYFLPYKNLVKMHIAGRQQLLTSETLVPLSNTGAVNEWQEVGALKILLFAGTLE